MIENQSVSKKARIDYQSGRSLLSELPLSIIDIILARLPFRDAVRTSLLSRQWRYTWTSHPYPVFEDRCRAQECTYLFEERMNNVITDALSRHTGSIQKFKLAIPFESCFPRIDEWVLRLSTKGIRELILEMACTKVDSTIYSCNKLTYLELFNCTTVVRSPSTFKGFLFLKCLVLQGAELDADQIESLVANSPLLERFILDSYGNEELRFEAPHLKYLDLIGGYIEMDLYAPLLSEMSVALHVIFTDEDLQQNIASHCNYTNFFERFTNLEKLSGSCAFTEYLSIGIESCHHSLVLSHLKIITQKQVNFEDIKEVWAVVRLVNGAPNLEKLEISTIVIAGRNDALEAPVDLRFASNLAFEKLRQINLCISGLPLMMKFIRFLLECSPALKTMRVVHCNGLGTEVEQKLRAELMGCTSASKDAKLSIYSKRAC